MRRALSNLLLCLALLAAVAASGESNGELTLEDVVARLGEPAVIRGSYTQAREIAVLERPLQSRGDFILSGRGLFWRQLSRPEAIVIADGERLLQQIGDGPPEISDDVTNPVVLPFSRIFLGIFTGDEEALREHFQIDFSPEGENWTIVLTPIVEPLSLAIQAITLRGREYIEELEVVNRSSDRTVIRFAGISTQPDRLSDEEIELYAR